MATEIRPAMDSMVIGQVELMVERWKAGEYRAEDLNTIRAAKRTLELAVLLGIIPEDEAPHVGAEGDD